MTKVGMDICGGRGEELERWGRVEKERWRGSCDNSAGNRGKGYLVGETGWEIFREDWWRGMRMMWRVR